MFKKKTITAKESKLALNAQRPIELSAGTFNDYRRKFSQLQTDNDLTWIKADEVAGIEFKICRIWSWVGDNGAKVGFEIELPNSEVRNAFALPWDLSRDEYVKGWKELVREHGKQVKVGPYTVELRVTGSGGVYKAVVPYVGIHQAKPGGEVKTRKARTPKETKPVKKTSIKPAKKIGGKKGTDEVPF